MKRYRYDHHSFDGLFFGGMLCAILAMIFALLAVLAVWLFPGEAHAACPAVWDCNNSLANPNGTLDPPTIANPPLRLYDSQGRFRGNYSQNPYDPNSTSNPYGRYGNEYSPDSLHNPFGAGNAFSGSRLPDRSNSLFPEVYGE